jgi:phosphoglycolate phosphatase-like HAD superfamily hydrolase
MNGIKNLFIDLDGPLLNGKQRHYFCYKSILLNKGFIPLNINDYWNLKRSKISLRILLEMSNAQEIYNDFIKDWLVSIESPSALTLDRVQYGAFKCLRIWKELSLNINLVTLRKNFSNLDKQLICTGLKPYLNSIIICNHEEGAVGKANKVYNHFSSNDLADNSLWIGDTEIDFNAANLLGCKCILLTNGLRTKSYLKSLNAPILVPSINKLKDFNGFI